MRLLGSPRSCGKDHLFKYYCLSFWDHPAHAGRTFLSQIQSSFYRDHPLMREGRPNTLRTVIKHGITLMREGHAYSGARRYVAGSPRSCGKDYYSTITLIRLSGSPRSCGKGLSNYASQSRSRGSPRSCRKDLLLTLSFLLFKDHPLMREGHRND